ncbi:(2Fe-2S)-binding protein [Falsiroseomonas ponticola]|uniref:(2Fe-2S)-binding protein n=1 Tax=Falsiroseomonas ponticola TaxID=2786951 RepID=UPI001933A44A|nr:2Fe-2S iron-sulfur cluster-binding protein [Roseomonas ponticola]
MRLAVNGVAREVPAEWRGESLLAVLRYRLGLTATRLGCGVGLCGACTVLVDGAAARSCGITAGEAEGRAITTFEGLGGSAAMRAVTAAWAAAAVPQCGYCQSGQVVTAAALLAATPAPGSAAIEAAMAGNLCRCGTQPRIRDAVADAARRLAEGRS